MFMIIRLHNLHTILLLVNFINFPMCVVDVIGNITCGDVLKYAEDITEVFNLCGMHIVLKLASKGSVNICIPLVDLEDFVKLFINLVYAS